MPEVSAAAIAESPNGDSVQTRMGPVPPEPAVRLRLIILVVALLVFQIALFASFASGLLDNIGYGAAHLGSCLLAWYAGRWMVGRTAKGVSVCLLQIIGWTALAGPFGAILSAALLALPDPRACSELSAQSPRKALLKGSRVAELRVALLDSRLPADRTDAPKSLFDVLAEGTEREKCEALTIIGKLYDPALAPALRRALSDVNAPVRVLAATVLAKLRAKFVKKVGALQSEVERAPELAHKWRELARARLDLAHSGLLDTLHSREETTRAQEDLERAASLQGHVEGTQTITISRKPKTDEWNFQERT